MLLQFKCSLNLGGRRMDSMVVYYKGETLNLGLQYGTLCLLELYATPFQLRKCFIEITDMLSLVFTSDN